MRKYILIYCHKFGLECRVQRVTQNDTRKQKIKLPPDTPIVSNPIAILAVGSWRLLGTCAIKNAEPCKLYAGFVRGLPLPVQAVHRGLDYNLWYNEGRDGCQIDVHGLTQSFPTCEEPRRGARDILTYTCIRARTSRSYWGLSKWYLYETLNRERNNLWIQIRRNGWVFMMSTGRGHLEAALPWARKGRYQLEGVSLPPCPERLMIRLLHEWKDAPLSSAAVLS